MSGDTSADSAADLLAAAFRRNGYVRRPNLTRRAEAKTKYKKGWEVRLVFRTVDEARQAAALLPEIGLKGGRPFAKSRQWIQPVYGKKAVSIFEEWAASAVKATRRRR